MYQEGEGLAFEKKHLTGHIGAICLTQKPFHISGLRARGNICMVKQSNYLKA